LPETARRYEYGTLGFESVYGLDASLDYINRIGMDAIEQRNLKLVQMLRERLQFHKVTFFTPEENRSPILTFFSENEQVFGKKMKENKIFITARRRKKGQIRVSPHFYNNEEDIEAFMRVFSSI